MADIMYLFDIAAPRARVYDALTTAAGIRNWWTRDAELEPAAGGLGKFGFFAGSRLTTVRVNRLEPEFAVAWSTIDSNVPGWDATTLTFELEPGGAGTTLRFAHRGFVYADDAYARTTWGWGVYFNSLTSYLTTGKGAPHGDN